MNSADAKEMKGAKQIQGSQG